MKYLVVYMSHHGTTRQIVLQMALFLGNDNTTVIDLNRETVPDLSAYETIVIGGSIHTGKIQRMISDFCSENECILLTKRIGLFICFMENYEKMEAFNNAFPERLRQHAIATGLFGGELLLDKMNFMERIFVKSVYGIKGNVSEINHPDIKAFEDKVKY